MVSIPETCNPLSDSESLLGRNRRAERDRRARPSLAPPAAAGRPARPATVTAHTHAAEARSTGTDRHARQGWRAPDSRAPAHTVQHLRHTSCTHSRDACAPSRFGHLLVGAEGAAASEPNASSVRRPLSHRFYYDGRPPIRMPGVAAGPDGDGHQCSRAVFAECHGGPRGQGRRHLLPAVNAQLAAGGKGLPSTPWRG